MFFGTNNNLYYCLSLFLLSYFVLLLVLKIIRLLFYEKQLISDVGYRKSTIEFFSLMTTFIILIINNCSKICIETIINNYVTIVIIIF